MTSEEKTSARGDKQRKPFAEGAGEETGRYHIVETFLRNQAPLQRFISRFLVPAQDIDDIAQEAFLRAYETEKQKRIDEPKAFLFRIAKNLMLTEFSKKSRKITDYLEDINGAEDLLESSTLEDSVIAQQKIGVLCEAVATLPPQCRKVFLLRKVYGMSYKEIADYLGIAISTIEKHLLKGIRQCEAYMAEHYSSNPKQDNEINCSSVKTASQDEG